MTSRRFGLLLAPLLLLAPACDSAGETETANMMAGCVPGESIACACENGLDGAQACADDGLSFAECICDPGMQVEDETTGGDGDGDAVPDHDHDTGPSGWILRDANGDVVDAVAEPSCRWGEDCLGNGAPIECVLVHSVAGAPVNVRYDLKSGSWADCVKAVIPEWYADAECTEPLVRAGDEAKEFGASLRTLISVNGQPFLTGAEFVSMSYCFPNNGTCECIEDTADMATVTDVEIPMINGAPFILERS